MHLADCDISQPSEDLLRHVSCQIPDGSGLDCPVLIRWFRWQAGRLTGKNKLALTDAKDKIQKFKWCVAGVAPVLSRGYRHFN